MARRVVVTGIGLLCGVGRTAPEVWTNLLAGKSGMAPIASFDTTGFPVTLAACSPNRAKFCMKTARRNPSMSWPPGASAKAS